MNVPLLMLMVLVPADEIVPAASGAVVVLVTLLNSKVAPPLVPNVSVPGVTCVPVLKTSERRAVGDGDVAGAGLPALKRQCAAADGGQPAVSVRAGKRERRRYRIW